MKLKLIIFFIILGLWAKEKLEPKKIRAKVVIEAEQSLYEDNNKLLAIFEGNVKIDDGFIKITCEKLRVLLDLQKRPYLMIATGNVIISKENFKGIAEKMTYQFSKKLIILEGNPEINQAGHKIRAKKINYNIKEQKISTPSVRAIFDNEKKKYE